MVIEWSGATLIETSWTIPESVTATGWLSSISTSSDGATLEDVGTTKAGWSSIAVTIVIFSVRLSSGAVDVCNIVKNARIITRWLRKLIHAVGLVKSTANFLSDNNKYSLSLIMDDTGCDDGTIFNKKRRISNNFSDVIGDKEAEEEEEEVGRSADTEEGRLDDEEDEITEEEVAARGGGPVTLVEVEDNNSSSSDDISITDDGTYEGTVKVWSWDDIGLLKDKIWREDEIAGTEGPGTIEVEDNNSSSSDDISITDDGT